MFCSIHVLTSRNQTLLFVSLTCTNLFLESFPMRNIPHNNRRKFKPPPKSIHDDIHVQWKFWFKFHTQNCNSLCISIDVNLSTPVIHTINIARGDRSSFSPHRKMDWKISRPQVSFNSPSHYEQWSEACRLLLITILPPPCRWKVKIYRRSPHIHPVLIF